MRTVMYVCARQIGFSREWTAIGGADPNRVLRRSGVASPKNHHEVPKMSNPVELGLAGRGVVAFALVTMLCVSPTGGYAGLGQRGGLAVGIQMDSEFLGNTYGWGSNTYHTFIAVHEVGHTLGFRHEQDRTGVQTFVLRDAGAGAVTIVNVNSGKCVDVDTGASPEGANVRLWTCNGSDTQRFTRRDAGGGFVSLVNAGSGKCIDVGGGSAANGANILQWTCHGGTNQQWRLE